MLSPVEAFLGFFSGIKKQGLTVEPMKIRYRGSVFTAANTSVEERKGNATLHTCNPAAAPSKILTREQ